MTGLVNSVLGPVEPDPSDIVLVHEHIHMAPRGSELDPTVRWDRELVIERATARMARLRELGVGLVVDATPVDLGRDAELLRVVSRASGVAIVAVTGFHAQRLGIPPYWRGRTVDEIAEFFVYEATRGIGPGIRPGAIKAATSSPISDIERKVVRAVGRAAARTGLPVLTHTDHSLHGEEQLELLAAEGVGPERCLIGHQERYKEAAAVARRGAFVGIDRVGMRIFGDDDERAAVVRQLVGSGYGDNVCLSQDHACDIKGFKPPGDLPADDREAYVRDVWPQRVEDAVGRRHEYILDDFVPRLRSAGLGEPDVTLMLTANPLRWLTGE